MKWCPLVILAPGRGRRIAHLRLQIKTLSQNKVQKERIETTGRKERGGQGGTVKRPQNQRDWNVCGSVQFDLVHKQTAFLDPSGATEDPTIKNKLVVGLERWLNSWEHFLFFQRTCVWCTALLPGSTQPPVTPEDLLPSSDLQGHRVHAQNPCPDIHIYS